MRRTLSAVVVVVLAMGTAACGPYTGGAIPPLTTDTYAITPGASVIIGSGGQAGYGITANNGGVYRLVWNGDASAARKYNRFWGSVWTPGAFDQVTAGCISNACPVESGDVVKQPVSIAGGQRVDFDAQTASGIDGFDVVVDTEPVYFDLVIDDIRDPALVFFSAAGNGGQISNAGVIPFGLQGTF